MTTETLAGFPLAPDCTLPHHCILTNALLVLPLYSFLTHFLEKAVRCLKVACSDLGRSSFCHAGSVRARAEAPAGYSLHLVEGHQLPLRAEDQAGDKISQWGCIHHHTGEGELPRTHAYTFSHFYWGNFVNFCNNACANLKLLQCLGSRKKWTNDKKCLKTKCNDS